MYTLYTVYIVYSVYRLLNKTITHTRDSIAVSHTPLDAASIPRDTPLETRPLK